MNVIVIVIDLLACLLYDQLGVYLYSFVSFEFGSHLVGRVRKNCIEGAALPSSLDKLVQLQLLQAVV